MNSHSRIILLGAGPGNIQIALQFQEVGIKNSEYLMLEKGTSVATSFKKFPIHNLLISNNKVINEEDRLREKLERYDWNSLLTKNKENLFSDYSRDFYPHKKHMVKMLNDLVINNDLPVQYGTSCKEVFHDGDFFYIVTNLGIFTCEYLVCGTGLVPKRAPIQGIELTTPYYKMKEKKYYSGKRVLIIGKGNSGLECAKEIMNEASYISCASPTQINFAYKTHYVGNVRLINAVQIENYLLKQNASILDCNISKIVEDQKGKVVTIHYTHANGEVENLYFDEIIDATGFQSEKGCLKNFELEYHQKNKFPMLDKNFESITVPNLFFSGAQTHGIDYKKTSGGFVHGFRYHSIILGNYLARKISSKVTQPFVRGDINQFIIDKFENSSGLFLQPGSLIHVVEKGQNTWIDLGLRTQKWFQEYSSSYIVLGISLEYGDIQGHNDILKVSRYPGQPDLSDHLHPILRKKVGEEIFILNLEENLFNEFDNDINRNRIEHFIASKNKFNNETCENSHVTI